MILINKNEDNFDFRKDLIYVLLNYARFTAIRDIYIRNPDARSTKVCNLLDKALKIQSKLNETKTVHFSYGECLLRMDQFDKALTHLESVINSAKEHNDVLLSKYYYFFSYCLYKLENFSKCDEMFEMAENEFASDVQLHPKYEKPIFLLPWINGKISGANREKLDKIIDQEIPKALQRPPRTMTARQRQRRNKYSCRRKKKKGKKQETKLNNYDCTHQMPEQAEQQRLINNDEMSDNSKVSASIEEAMLPESHKKIDHGKLAVLQSLNGDRCIAQNNMKIAEHMGDEKSKSFDDFDVDIPFNLTVKQMELLLNYGNANGNHHTLTTHENIDDYIFGSTIIHMDCTKI